MATYGFLGLGIMGQEMAGNLLENAIKWSEKSIALSVTDRVDASGKRWMTLSVEDDGPGINPAERETALQRISTRTDNWF